MTDSRIDDHRWEPLPLDQAVSLFSRIIDRWWVAGGWAIDLYVGEETRPHGDLDVAMLRGDQAQLARLLPEWDICVAHDGTLTPWLGDLIEAPRHQFWMRQRGRAAWQAEVLLEDHRQDVWTYRRHPRVIMPLDEIGESTADGVPYLRPVIALLYKARAGGLDRDEADFAVTAPRLSLAERAWLRDALRIAHPGHSWIERL